VAEVFEVADADDDLVLSSGPAANTSG